MYSKKQKVTVELVNKDMLEKQAGMTNPINTSRNINNISDMVTKILDEELPMLKNNSLLHDLVLYTLKEKMNTVQNVENVLSYIKENGVKEVRDINFRNGEVCIKCSI